MRFYLTERQSLILLSNISLIFLLSLSEIELVDTWVTFVEFMGLFQWSRECSLRVIECFEKEAAYELII